MDLEFWDRRKCGFVLPDQDELQKLRHEDRVRRLAGELPGLDYVGAHEYEALVTYDKLPKSLRSHKTSAVELVEGSSVCRRVLKDRWVGWYDSREVKLFIKWSQLTLVHELIHDYTVFTMTAEQWTVWESAWRLNRQLFPEYGQKNAAEGLAEAGCYYLVKGPGVVKTALHRPLERALGIA
jgi:hypothetical protein